MKMALESRSQIKMGDTHLIWLWLVTCAGMPGIVARVDDEGRTTWERRNGRSFIRELPEFGEHVLRMKPDSFGKDKAGARWGEVCISGGIRFESSNLLMITERGAIKVRSYKRTVEGGSWCA